MAAIGKGAAAPKGLSSFFMVPPPVLTPLAGFATHLSEVWPATELKLQHQGTVGDLVHIFAFWKKKKKNEGERDGATLAQAGNTSLDSILFLESGEEHSGASEESQVWQFLLPSDAQL